MLDIQLKINAAELAAAINNLAAAISGAKKDIKEGGVEISAAAQASTPAAEVTAAPAAPAAQPAPSTVVPTAAPRYTLDMIAAAGSALIDAGKMEQLMQLLGKFGVASLVELTPDRYGAVAAELRALGAAI